MIELDHIAVAGETLDAACDLVEETLGVRLQPGGRHALFGTHNRLLGLADRLYLEVIAIDPEAPPPGRPRWFDLDRFSGPPRLTNWICRTSDMIGMLAALPDGAGTPVEVARGDLRWQMAVPTDGQLPCDNMFPALIQWQGDVHPAALLQASGCRLSRLTVTHPRAVEMAATLAPHLDDPRVVIESGTPGLVAEIDTPHGRRVLE